jgi:uncharacterized membrane protein YbhN (UPF0104 family)
LFHSKPSFVVVKKVLITLAKFGVSSGIIAYLAIRAHRDGTFIPLIEQPKHWGLLALAFCAYLAAVLLSFLRWRALVVALGLTFSVRDALRLGFLGYLFNFVSLGSVGGDLFKAVFIAREQPGFRAEAVATVVMDRILGLLMLLVLASAAILATGQLHSTVREVQIISQGTLAATAAGLVGLGMLAVVSAFEGAWRRWLGRLPLVGAVAEKLLSAVVAYRHKPGVLAWSCLLSLAIHSCCTLSVYWIALGLPGEAPSLADHFVIVPLALVTGALPLPVNGLGAMEYAVDALYLWIPASGALPEGRGFVVALGYRAATILAAFIAAVYYLASRREVAQVLEEAEFDMAQS